MHANRHVFTVHMDASRGWVGEGNAVPGVRLQMA